MNKDFKFLGKVIRNGFILAGIYFVSVFATSDLTYEVCKPIIVFYTGYVFAELARHYGLNPTKINKKGQTLIF